MTRMAEPSDKLGVLVKMKGWVQTERKSHEAWSQLALKKSAAAALLHQLVAQMGNQNAIVISQKTLAKIMGVHVRTISRAVADLVEGNWIQVVKLGKGKEVAYVVNSAVAWAQTRDQLYLSKFHATVIADKDDQDSLTLEHRELRKIPVLFPGEMQLPTGEGLPPPSQLLLDGFEPDLPALKETRTTPDSTTMKKL